MTAAAANDPNWPEFRGPNGDGTASCTNLPLTWSEQENLLWQRQIPGKAWSSPVVWANQIWLTTATETGTELSALCVDLETGRTIHDLKLFRVEKPQYCHPFNSYASPTPAIEAGRVYVTFGSAGTACLDTATGKVLWERRDLVCNHFRGPGSSPILYRDWVFLNYDGSDEQYVVAFEKKTGRTAWIKKRSIDFRDLDLSGMPQSEGDFRKAFATCTVARLNGVESLVSQGSKAIYAYEPHSGEELWRVEEMSSYSGSTRPVIWKDLVIVPSGFPAGILLAIRPGQKGEVLDAKNARSPGGQLEIVWKSRPANVPEKPSALVIDNLLFTIDDNGTATCRDPATGETIWSEKIDDHYSASPIAIPGRIYFFSEEGKTTVIAPGRVFKKLAESKMGDGYMASPAVAGDSLILRSRSALYRAALNAAK